MAPTVCLADMPEEPRVPFSLETHLLNIKSTFSEGAARSLTIRRRPPHRVFRFRNHKVRTLLMGLVVDDCQQSINREADSPELQYSESNSSTDSIESSKPWPKTTCTQQHLHMLRRREGLLDITLRTMALLRRNQQLQHRLSALQAETRAFVQSVLSNPENQHNDDSDSDQDHYLPVSADK